MNNYTNYFNNQNQYQNLNANQYVSPLNNIADPYEGFKKGNMFKDLYDPYKISKPYEIMPANDQAKMLTNLNSLGFALIDLNLYLDVFPNDRQMIDLYNRYRIQKNELTAIYENQYGPLDLSSNALNTYPWSWDDKPWPWEN